MGTVPVAVDVTDVEGGTVVFKAAISISAPLAVGCCILGVDTVVAVNADVNGEEVVVAADVAPKLFGILLPLAVLAAMMEVEADFEDAWVTTVEVVFEELLLLLLLLTLSFIFELFGLLLLLLVFFNLLAVLAKLDVAATLAKEEEETGVPIPLFSSSTVGNDVVFIEGSDKVAVELVAAEEDKFDPVKTEADELLCRPDAVALPCFEDFLLLLLLLLAVTAAGFWGCCRLLLLVAIAEIVAATFVADVNFKLLLVLLLLLLVLFTLLLFFLFFVFAF